MVSDEKLFAGPVGTNKIAFGPMPPPFFFLNKNSLV